MARREISILQGLVRTLRDSHDGFQLVAKGLTGKPEIERKLGLLALERNQLCEELERQLERAGASPTQEGTLMEAIYRGWIELQREIGEVSSERVLREAEAGESHVVARYEKALKEKIEPRLAGILRLQLEQVKKARERVRELRTGSA